MSAIRTDRSFSVGFVACAISLFNTMPLKVLAAAPKTFADTSVAHNLEFGLTNTKCDSVLSPSQCFDFLVTLEGPAAPDFDEISLKNAKHASIQIDRTIGPRVSIDEGSRAAAIRSLVLLARQAVTRLGAVPQAEQVPERKVPVAILNLEREQGIARVELFHRLLISGDRILVSQTLVNRTEGTEGFNRGVSIPRVSELNTEIEASLGSETAKTLRTVSDLLTLNTPSSESSPALNRQPKTD